MSKLRLLKFVVTLSLLLSFSGWAVAQSSDAQSQTPQENSKKEKKEKKDKKKKKKDKGSQDVLDSEVFSDAVARNVLDDLRDGLEGHSYRLFESAFSEDMDGYLTFQDAVEAMFQRYSEFRVHFQIAQTTTEGPKGVILVDIQMEQIPNAGPTASMPQPQRRESQVRFELERGKKGWKIVDFSPRGFFS